ncbi:hypothetical protein COHA_007378 [Chlorella ohadii]|uniref:Sulfotransferase n=1 Tax=Chlorella ohadii TaxID=2649997 RepID=A0AAD5DJ03_9CHLO|nr:hypothetical protein COHA_007378 [Chlorella ohadii]
MAHVKGQGGVGLRWPRQPRLVACLAAWAFLASLVCLQRSGSAGSDCQRASGGMQEAAASGGGTAATQPQGSVAGSAQPHRQQQQAADEWPELRGLSREKVEALIRAPAGLHGRVHKGGLPANYMFMMAHLTDTDAHTREEGIPRFFGPMMYQWFAKAFTFDKTAGQSNRDLQSPVPACHFWADHKYKLLYVRNFKTAGTSISLTLGQKELPMYCSVWPDSCAKKCEGKQVCLENVIDPDKLRQLFQQYTVFSFVRNPWARALSSWHHVHKLGIHAPCQEPFERWAELPSRYGAKCLGIRNCCKRRFGWLLEHTEPQTTCLFDDQGQPAVDFLGRVENLDEDMQELVQLINSRLDAGVEPLKVGELPRFQLARQDMEDQEEARWRYYSEFYANSSTALQDIRNYFHADFDLLKVPMPAAGGGS